MMYIIVLALGGLFGLIGALLLIVGIVNQRKAQTSQGWPTVPGRITSSKLVTHMDSDDDGSSSIMYEPAVDYVYVIAGQQYIGRRVSFGANRFDQRHAEQILQRYVQGATVNVYYDPNNPSEAVLETKSSGSKVFIIVGAIFLVITLVVCCIGAVVAFLAPTGGLPQ